MTFREREVDGLLGERLAEFDPAPADQGEIVKGARLRRRRRRSVVGGLIATALVVVAVAVYGGPSDTPLNPPTVRASAHLSLPGRILDSSSAGGTLWVLTCTARCDDASAQAPGSGYLVQIDDATGSVLDTTPVEDPHSLAIEEDAIWVVNSFEESVSRFDPSTGALVATVPVAAATPLGEGSEALRFIPIAVTVGDGAVWVGSDRGLVAEIDPVTNHVTRVIDTVSPADDLAVAGGSVLFAAQLDGLKAIDPESGAVTDLGPVEDGSGRRLAVTRLLVVDGSLWLEGFWARPSGVSGYVATDDKAIAKVDPSSGQVEELVAVPSTLSIEAGHGSRIWLATSSSTSVYGFTEGGKAVHLVARLAGRGTIVGSIGESLWVATKRGDVAQFRLPR